MALLLCLPALGVNLAGGCAARCAAPRMQLASSAATNIGIQKRKLGDTDLLVSECCLGGMTWGNQNSAEDAADQLSLAFDSGVNFIDTAEAYPIALSPETSGATDRAIAKWISLTKRPRDSVVISTKVCGYNDRYTWLRKSGEGTRLSKDQILESVDDSLGRLETDYIDVLQLHWPDRPMSLTGKSTKERSRGVVPFEDQVEALKVLVDAGKVRHWGLSNEDAHGLREFRRAAAEIGLAPPVCMQNAYSLLQRADEEELVADCMDEDGEAAPVSYLAYSPLSAGTLTGKYAQPKPKGNKKPVPRRSRLGQFRGYSDGFAQSGGPAAVDAYIAVARKHGLTPTQLALAHCNSRSFVGSTIIGATSMSQLAENLMSFNVEWTQELEDEVLAVHTEKPNPWRVQLAGLG